MRHWFLIPSMKDPRYLSGGWQVFTRLYHLVSARQDAELVTYRHQEEGFRHLDSIPVEELNQGIVWVTWQSHVTELAERLARCRRVVLYAQAVDFGRQNGQVTPDHWPIVCVSHYIAADYSVRHPWRLIQHLGPALHSEARNRGETRDIDVLVHRRKGVPYVLDELTPALEKVLKVEVVTRFLGQEEFLDLLNRSKVYLYWAHKLLGTMGVFEGFGMQPLEAIACGAIPISNLYGGLGDYLEAPYNCRKIGVHSLEYDVAQTVRAVREHVGRNPDEERLRHWYGEAMCYERFARIEQELLFYFENCPRTRHQRFVLEPPGPPLYRRPYVWLHRTFWRTYKQWRGIRPQ